MRKWGGGIILIIALGLWFFYGQADEKKPENFSLKWATDVTPSELFNWTMIRKMTSEGKEFSMNSDDPIVKTDNEAIYKIDGGAIKTSHKTGDNFSPADIIRTQTPQFLAAVLRPNMKAYQINLDGVMKDYGLLRPGNYVDLIYTRRGDNNNNGIYDSHSRDEGFSGVAIANVRVIAVNEQLLTQPGTNKNKPDTDQGLARSVITLELTENQVNLISLARQYGVITASINSFYSVNKGHGEPLPVTRISSNQIMGESDQIAGNGKEQWRQKKENIKTLYGDEVKNRNYN